MQRNALFFTNTRIFYQTIEILDTIWVLQAFILKKDHIKSMGYWDRVVKGARGMFPLKLSPSSNFPLRGEKKWFFFGGGGKKIILLHNIHPCFIYKQILIKKNLWIINNKRYKDFTIALMKFLLFMRIGW